MNYKPIITYAGSGPLFRSLEAQILNALPLDTSEWRRAFQRPLKHVRLEAQTQPFNLAPLEQYKNGDWSILSHPILHIFVTECNDVDNYKATIREEIRKWLLQLTNYGIQDWMILLVETLDVRKTKNLLPRTTVLDKIRVEFGSKNDDRIISVLNPAKFEQKATESFRCLVQRIRFLMLGSYNRNISKYEELIRAKREKRNHESWDFRQFFFMQEDLALIYEKMELYTEALIQYDELDAMFSQLVATVTFSTNNKWLKYFKHPLTSFHGICLNRRHMFVVREKLRGEQGVSILEFRNYLFERQAHLLMRNSETAEIAKRLLNFLYTTLQEVDLLKLESMEGALACWEFVCALEVLQTCDLAMQPTEVQCFHYCAPIWNLAKDKLYELGTLCGLLPGFTPNSQQLHTVVLLCTGIGDALAEQQTTEFLEASPQISAQKRDRSPNRRRKKAAIEQLKEALSSSQAFQKLYLELAELAISTYKHISRLRSARLVGLDLGNFYCALNEPHKAVGFYTDLLRELKAENWPVLSAQILLQLANCYRKMGDTLAYTKTCSSICSCQDLEMVVRNFYFDEFKKSASSLGTSLSALPTAENANFCVLEDNFGICSVKVMNALPIVQDDLLTVAVHINSLYPREIVVESIKLSYEMHMHGDDSYVNVPLGQSSCVSDMLMKMSLHLDYKEDKTLACASVGCDTPKAKKPVRRTSSTRRKLSPSIQSDFSNCVTAENVLLKPGNNVVEMKCKATRVGLWQFKQMSVQISKLVYLSEELPFKAELFEITTKPASAVLDFKELIAGIEQPIRLIVSSGSFIFANDAKITLKCSKNLRIRFAGTADDATFVNTLDVPLENFKSFEVREIALEVLTELPGPKVMKPHEHFIALSCPWSRSELQICLEFVPAIKSTCRLHTCEMQKFLQVVMEGLEPTLLLKDAQVKCCVPDVHLTDLNPILKQPIKIYKTLEVSYMYEIAVKQLFAEKERPVKVQFEVKYAREEQPHIWRNYDCSFELVDYATLFKVQAQLEPNELCRVRSVCNLNLKISKVQPNPYTDLMYEVLNEQNLWAVCGRSAGVVSMKDVDSHSIALDVMPLSTGFLPMPSIRLSKYSAAGKNKSDMHSKVVAFPPGQVYNSTKSLQIHVIANNNSDQ